MSERKPLAEDLRPTNFSQFIGQTGLRDKLANLQEQKRLPSILFFGPPGSGKSTAALLLARNLNRDFIRVSAPETGLADLRRQLEQSDTLILDELHRFSKAQQDFFLPHLEAGRITLLATTTENPAFSLTNQLLSRLLVLRFNPLNRDELLAIAERAKEHLGLDLPLESLDRIISVSHGDARSFLNFLEYCRDLPQESLDPVSIAKLLPEIVQRGDRDGDSHYELASALIKSIRGSDPDAALYYLACMLERGEDPRFICRRLILSASEDVGLADPEGLNLAVSCLQAVETIGMPEGFIPLSETTVYLALAPKSNSAYSAYLAAQKEIRKNGIKPVPLHLRNPASGLQRKWGFGQDYKYPHAYTGAWVEQEYLPEEVRGKQFYQPKDQGQEPSIFLWLKKKLRASRKKRGSE
ncbi:MAG: replication-associated recombination protein A [Desulfohalobiaceae bacterium]